MGLYDSPTHIVQQSRARAFAHVGFETLAYSRRQIDKEYISNIILNKDLAIFILVSIFLIYIFDEDNEMVHYYNAKLSLASR